MSNLASVSRLALLTLVASTGLMAQEGWVGSLKLGAGPTTGQLKNLTGNAGYSFAPEVEAAYKFNKADSVVLGLGFRFFPGDMSTPSYIPTVPGSVKQATALPAPASLTSYAAGGPYEARIRKPDAKGLELTAMYRHDYTPDFYVQGGMRLGLYKMNVRDTGSRITYGVTSVNTPATSTTVAQTTWSLTPTSIVTIMDDMDKKTTSVGLVGGLGYRLTDMFSVEANVFTVRLGDPRGSTSTGVASEIAFGIRF